MDRVLKLHGRDPNFPINIIREIEEFLRTSFNGFQFLAPQLTTRAQQRMRTSSSTPRSTRNSSMR